MHICGIIAEYNPFHLGHALLIRRAREAGATHIAAVMSGSFVQRGDAALCSKWARAEMALHCGADLVFELPLPYATATAQRFSLGAVATLDALGVADTLAFGSECGDTGRLAALAAAAHSDEVRSLMRAKLDAGAPFAAAREAALTELGFDGALLSGANDTLAVSYISAINSLGSDMNALAVKREGASHDGGASDGYASASFIRDAVIRGDAASATHYMPCDAARIMLREADANRCPALLNRLEPALLARLRTMSIDDMAALPDVSEGLENRLMRAVRECNGAEDIIAAVKSKRYTHARIRRILLCALLGVTREVYDSTPQYIRVLGMNARGREILAAARPALPVITRAKDATALTGTAAEMFGLECRADDLYALTLPVRQPCGSNLSNGIIII